MEKDTKSRYIKHFYKNTKDEFIILPRSLKKSRETINHETIFVEFLFKFCGENNR